MSCATRGRNIFHFMTCLSATTATAMVTLLWATHALGLRLIMSLPKIAPLILSGCCRCCCFLSFDFLSLLPMDGIWICMNFDSE